MELFIDVQCPICKNYEISYLETGALPPAGLVSWCLLVVVVVEVRVRVTAPAKF